MKGSEKNFSPAKETAYIAVACALLLAGQYALSFVAGVEIVTLLFVCFSSAFGVRRGVILALAFSLLRCFIFGFTPAVIVLYLIYYPLLAAIFGVLGHFGDADFSKAGFAVAVNVLLSAVCAACAVVYALDLIKISRIYEVAINVLIWVIFCACVVLLAAFDVVLFVGKSKGKGGGAVPRVIAYAAVAAVCTICFTLLDDVISPVFYGMGGAAALAYFYASFTAMLPQTVCSIVSVTALFVPIDKIFSRFAPVRPRRP